MEIVLIENLLANLSENLVIDLSKRRSIGQGVTPSDLETYSEDIKDRYPLALYWN